MVWVSVFPPSCPSGFLVSRFGRNLECYSCTDSMITDALQRIANRRESLTREEARAVMTEVFSGVPPTLRLPPSWSRCT